MTARQSPKSVSKQSDRMILGAAARYGGAKGREERARQDYIKAFRRPGALQAASRYSACVQQGNAAKLNLEQAHYARRVASGAMRVREAC